MAEEETDSLDALEYELNQMGLSVEDLQPPEDGHYDRRAMARVESARIMSRRFIERDRLKDKITTRTKVRTTTGCCMFLLPSAKHDTLGAWRLEFAHPRSLGYCRPPSY